MKKIIALLLVLSTLLSLTACGGKKEDDKKEDAEREAMRWYTIKSGDTLGRIAINNGTTVNALCRLNGIKPTTTLKIGRKIRVR